MLDQVEARLQVMVFSLHFNLPGFLSKKQEDLGGVVVQPQILHLQAEPLTV